MKTNSFSTGDFNIINGVLQTSYSVMRRYEYEQKSDNLWREIKFVLDNFALPLTNLFVVSKGITCFVLNDQVAFKYWTWWYSTNTNELFRFVTKL